MRIVTCLALFSISLTACSDIDVDDSESPDGEFEQAVAAGKADGSTYTDCELDQTLVFVNQTDTDYQRLRDAGVHGAAAKRIPRHRNGIDGLAATGDDNFFDTIGELDDVPYVGPVALRTLVAHVASECEVGSAAEVIFSPTFYPESHLARVVELLDGASATVDIAMYSLSDSQVVEAIENAALRGVSVRMILEQAAQDRRDPEGTRSARFEDLGIEVRWVNKIMHHKFAILDGPRTGIDLTDPGTLVTGSGNWSYSAGTRYDENTIVLHGNAEALVAFQQEYELLWDNGRLVEWNEEIPPVDRGLVDTDLIEDDPHLEVLFTSANFEVRQSTRYGPTFSAVRGRRVVTDRLVELILSAEHSVHIASGHLRNRGVTNALITAWENNPDLDIRIYTDGQEYIGSSTHAREQRELGECLERAGDSATRQEDCVERGLHYGYALHLAGIPVRYKYYSYRWDYHYAAQMHHKYLIIDGHWLVTGSYNLSNNAERSTMENMVIYDAVAFPNLLAEFEANFELLWDTGRAEGLYANLQTELVDGQGEIPLVFASMALDWNEVTDLKRLIRDVCPAVNTQPFRREANSHRTCPRE